MQETFNHWLRRQTTITLLLWQKGSLTEEETLQKLCELSWSPADARRLMECAYLLLPVM